MLTKETRLEAPLESSQKLSNVSTHCTNYVVNSLYKTDFLHSLPTPFNLYAYSVIVYLENLGLGRIFPVSMNLLQDLHKTLAHEKTLMTIIIYFYRHLLLLS